MAHTGHALAGGGGGGCFWFWFQNGEKYYAIDALWELNKWIEFVWSLLDFTLYLTLKSWFTMDTTLHLDILIKDPVKSWISPWQLFPCLQILNTKGFQKDFPGPLFYWCLENSPCSDWFSGDWGRLGTPLSLAWRPWGGSFQSGGAGAPLLQPTPYGNTNASIARGRPGSLSPSVQVRLHLSFSVACESGGVIRSENSENII